MMNKWRIDFVDFWFRVWQKLLFKDMDWQNWYFFGQKNGDWWKVEQTSPVDYLDIETHPHI